MHLSSHLHVRVSLCLQIYVDHGLVQKAVYYMTRTGRCACESVVYVIIVGLADRGCETIHHLVVVRSYCEHVCWQLQVQPVQQHRCV